MSESLNFNPALPESRQFTPPAEGGNGAIHKPGDYQNLIWQTRSRVPENWEITLISTLEDVCPHAYALLSQGFVEDGKVECPLHEAVFDVKTGQCLHGPGGRNLNRYPVRVFENQIQITFVEETVA